MIDSANQPFSLCSHHHLGKLLASSPCLKSIQVMKQLETDLKVDLVNFSSLLAPSLCIVYKPLLLPDAVDRDITIASIISHLQ